MEVFYNKETNVIKMPPMQLHIDPKGIGHSIFSKMNEFSKNIAQINAATGDSCAHTNLLSKFIRAAIVLQRKGIEANDVIVVCSDYHENTIVPLGAALFTGAIFCPFDVNLDNENLKCMLDKTNPKFVFISTDKEVAFRKLNMNCEIVVFGKSRFQFTSFDDFLVESQEEKQFQPYVVDNLNKIAAILFSSGTTSGPKPVNLTHMYLFSVIRECYHGICFIYTPICWITRFAHLITMLQTGGTEVYNVAFDPEQMWNLIYKYKINSILVSSKQLMQMCNYKDKKFDSLKFIMTGGKVVSTETLKKFYTTLKDYHFMNVYGITEVGWVYKIPFPFPSNKIESVGLPENGRAYKIVDIETDKTVGFNKLGELCIKTDCGFSGYYKTDSSSYVDKDGFYKTGDLGYYDNDFYFYIVERVKEIFKHKSTYIFPIQLENILLKHPDIQFGAIIGITKESSNDCDILAIVQVKEDSTLTPNDIIEYFNSQVDDNNKKLSGGVKLIDKMPITPSGKIRKNVLRSMIAEKIL